MGMSTFALESQDAQADGSAANLGDGQNHREGHNSQYEHRSP